MDRTHIPGNSSGERPRAVYESRGARMAASALTGVWLLYLVGPVVDLFTQHYSMFDRVFGLTLILVFSVIYVTFVPNWPMRPARALYAVIALAALATVACVMYGGTGASTLWIFISSASGLLIPDRRHAVIGVMACTAFYVLFALTGHVGSESLLGNLLPVIFIGIAMIGLRRQFQLTAELELAREEVAQLAANEERLRLARDMHDLTGQSLSTITLKSELAARLLDRLPAGAERDRARDEVEQVAAVSRQTLRDIREALSGYRRPTLAVEVITARAALASAGIAARDDTDLTLLSGTFDADAEAALAWCLREAVTNVVRHSGARNCDITLTRRKASLTLTVSDDGQGHTPATCQATTSPATTSPASAGTGLHGMSERLSAVGGSLELRPDEHPGFRLIATVPATQEAAAAPRPIEASGNASMA
jgi:two-component system, NarL family, sensor histidine kinase DesK